MCLTRSNGACITDTIRTSGMPAAGMPAQGRPTQAGEPGPSALAALRAHFGYDAFRPGQADVVSAVLAGRDVLAVMPTGAGKSICYQVPAAVRPGFALVVSPLVSLMKDQVQALREAGIPAAFLNSTLLPHEHAEVMRRALAGEFKLLYVAPERLENAQFTAFAAEAPLSLIAVDEAHCVSQWGQDFRPSYLRIAQFTAGLPMRPPVIALTATATQKVRSDIVSMLGLRDPHITVTGFDRPNLRMAVERLPEQKKLGRILQLVRERPRDSGIIYCQTRACVEQVHTELAAAGLPATRYHAGLSAAERTANQRAFITDDAPVMVATNAFGMGIDKSNVRYVAHFNMPSSIEAYYQEAGRAGRDGEPAECLLLWNDKDISTARFLIANAAGNDDLPPEEAEVVAASRRQMLNAMCGYCLTTRCLRQHILAYFGESTSEGAACGNCSNCSDEVESVDVTDEARAVMRCVQAMRGSFGKGTIAAVLRGKANERVTAAHLHELPCFGAVQLSDAQVKDLIGLLAAEGYLSITEGRYPLVGFGPRFREAAAPGFTFTIKRVQRTARGQRSSAGATNAGPVDDALFERLRALRKRIADAEGVPPYIVFSDAALRDMCAQLPRTPEELLAVKGVGEKKLERYGAAFLAEIAEHGTASLGTPSEAPEP